MKKKLTEEEIEEMLSYAKASLAIEGLDLTPEDEKLIKTKLRREISQKEFLKRAKEEALKKNS